MSKTQNINKMLALPSQRACSARGADMGRRNQIEGNPERLHLQKLRLVDGGYDTGGAYWGGGKDIPPMWCAFSNYDTQNEFPIRVFVRGWTRVEAKQKVLKLLKGEGWTFYR